MHPNDLNEFRDKVAMPRMMELFKRTQIPDGACFIDILEIEFLDGRSCGVDSHVRASGLVYQNGRAEEYLYDEYDVVYNDFFAAHKDCIFISDGNLRLYDELDDMVLETRLKNIQSCKKLFSWFDISFEINFQMDSIQYEKLKYISEHQSKSSLDLQIESAQNKSKDVSVSDSSVKVTEPER